MFVLFPRAFITLKVMLNILIQLFPQYALFTKLSSISQTKNKRNIYHINTYIYIYIMYLYKIYILL